MWICRYFLYFIVCSCLGWLWECTYGILVTGKWENRGFLYGPICPIYGSGVVAVMGLMEAGHSLHYDVDNMSYVLIFAVSFFGSVILEYGTHYLLEYFFHAYWWDYSNMPLNIKGRVCLPASIAFGFAGIAVVKLLGPGLDSIAGQIPPIVIEAVGMLVLMIGTADATLTISALTDFEKRVSQAEASLNGRMENLVSALGEKKEDAAEWIIEGKDLLYRFSTDNVVDYMSRSYRSAISRIKTFKEIPNRVTKAVSNTVTGGNTETASRKTAIMNHTLQVIKRRIRK